MNRIDREERVVALVEEAKATTERIIAFLRTAMFKLELVESSFEQLVTLVKNAGDGAQILAEIQKTNRGIRDINEDAESQLEKLVEIFQKIDTCFQRTLSPENESAIPVPHQVEKNLLLQDLGLPKQAVRLLDGLGVKTLSDLVRCRWDDLRMVPGMSRRSLEELREYFREENIPITMGSSYVDILRLLKAASYLVDPHLLESNGSMIFYVSGSADVKADRSKIEFRDLPRFYFQAFDQVLLFLGFAKVCDPQRRLEGLGFPSF